MDRIDKELFISEAWEYFKTDNDNVEIPKLSILNDNQINAMVSYYETCYKEEKSKLELKKMREDIISKFREKGE